MNKRLAIILVSIFSILIIFAVISFNIFSRSKDENVNENKNEANNIEMIENQSEILNFISSIAGLQANNIEVIKDPIGIKGELFAPEETILNGVNYFLEKTNNEKMKDVKINIGEGYISIYVNYEALNNIKTPVEVKVKPSINAEENLVITIDEVRFLDLKIADWVVNLALKSFVKDWFPEDGKINVKFNKGDVIVYKDNFKGINLKSLSLEETGLKINTIIDLKDVSND
ncbi:hypothetical protein [Clostridium sp.]|uniref:hypothetical protein n=1 Tax=Clostridium sp. TaxID=1506 RepID=UPI0025BE8C38|nr:hypothetical protein [Clostridium sp.]